MPDDWDAFWVREQLQPRLQGDIWVYDQFRLEPTYAGVLPEDDYGVRLPGPLLQMLVWDPPNGRPQQDVLLDDDK
jgi:hypothetical protein